MKFDCGHDGCDICGRRTCEGQSLNVVGRTPKGTPRFLICEYCEVRAVEIIIRICSTFAASFERADPCGRAPKS